MVAKRDRKAIRGRVHAAKPVPRGERFVRRPHEAHDRLRWSRLYEIEILVGWTPDACAFVASCPLDVIDRTSLAIISYPNLFWNLKVVILATRLLKVSEYDR